MANGRTREFCVPKMYHPSHDGLDLADPETAGIPWVFTTKLLPGDPRQS